MWPQIIEGILFAHRVSRHSSSKYSPFMLVYNRQPVLSIDVKHNLGKNKSNEPFDLDNFDAVFSSAAKVRTAIAKNAGENLKAAQEKQKQ